MTTDEHYLFLVRQAVNIGCPIEKGTEDKLVEISSTNFLKDSENPEDDSQNMEPYNKMAEALELLATIQTTESHHKIMEFLETNSDIMNDNFKSNVLKQLHHSTSDKQLKGEIWEKINSHHQAEFNRPLRVRKLHIGRSLINLYYVNHRIII
jgi:hypothetical protein